ncbi:macrophage mannose receptor 1-like isoform X3 [Onychostoma macrolepis]|uniref:macrophage mannose receptor 1-like isoform X3 n=1 Tax=Onychostoma macrolepis TaxID=369639 RepID=UPI00272AADE3|nr:macrophage mannose receptor 1-like isoform X3 [Onychostoma macrolepis]
MNQLYIYLLALSSAFNSETNSFLIYNKDHNKCVYAVNATVVQAAPCDVSSEAQHFRWISSSQILNLFFNRCLGSEEVKDWTKIILLPCNDLSPMQTWECVWSRWLIYGMEENLCSCGNQVFDHHEEGVSLFCICFSSFIVVGLFSMTAAVIRTNIRSKAKGNTGPAMTFTSKQYENA